MSQPKTSIAVMAKAPVPGFAKTRLIPAIGAHAAAVLAERMTERTLLMALAADVGPVTLWCAPDITHASFRDLAARLPIALKRQSEGDLGARMLAALAAEGGPALAIGSDCPALTPSHMRDAAQALGDADVVLIPAEDGGYVLIGTRVPQAELFAGIAWSIDTVLAQTRARVTALGLRAIELLPLWDVDGESDLARMERELPALTLR
jgi:uncharacterized protein